MTAESGVVREDRAALLALAERVESGSGPDRELDAAIFCAVLCPPGSKIEKSRLNGEWCVYTPVTYGKDPFRIWEKPMPWRRMEDGPTSSLDATVALLERVLPGEPFTLRFGEASNATVRQASSYSWSPARALLAATLRALSDKGRG